MALVVNLISIYNHHLHAELVCLVSSIRLVVDGLES